MKIAYVCNEYPPRRHGGMGRFVYTIAHAMKEAGHEVTVVGLGAASEEYDDSGVRVVTLRGRRIRPITWALKRLLLHLWLKRQESKGHIDIVEVPDYGGMLPFPFRACPVVVRLHITSTAIAKETGEDIPATIRWCEYWTLRQHKNWVGVSRSVLDNSQAVFSLQPKRSTVLFNPISPPVKQSVDQLPPIPKHYVLYAGIIGRRKRSYLLAEAARTFLADHPDLHLVLAGRIHEDGGVSADKKIQSIVGSELAKRIHFTGFLNHDVLREVMHRAIAFVFPSTEEAMPLAIVEAMHAGAPVVVPDVPPFTEFIQHRSNGMLVRAGDPGHLAEAVADLMKDADLRKSLAASSRQTAQSLFSLETCVTRSVAFYQQVLGDGA